MLINLEQAKEILPGLDTAALRQTIDVLLRSDYTGTGAVINAIAKASFDMTGDNPDSARKHYEVLTVETVHDNPFRYNSDSPFGTIRA